MKVSRDALVKHLHRLDAGLSPKMTVEQSSDFVFKDGEVMTFNGEIACRSKSMLNGVEGAVSATEFKSILEKMHEDEVDITATKKEVLITGKNKASGIRLDPEVTLPIEQVEVPQKWKKLPHGFAEAIDMVCKCASNEEQFFYLTCVHVHPNWVEASDNIHAIRYMIDTGFTERALVRHTSLRHIVELEMTKVSETDNYVHFKAPSGLILSCRKFTDEFPNLTKFLEVEGSPVTLPKSLVDGAARAEVFSSEDKEANRIRVQLKDRKLTLKGEGSKGWYKEAKKTSYKGEPVAFYISPKLLVEIIEKHDEAVINNRRLAVRGEKYIYVSSLQPVKKESKRDEEETED